MDINDFATADLFDARDVQERIDEIPEEIKAAETPGEYESLRDELASLTELAEQIDMYSEDGTRYGCSVIAGDYFVTYAQELAEDVCEGMNDRTWPLTHIDWEGAAEALQQDYSAFEWQGTTWWVQ